MRGWQPGRAYLYKARGHPSPSTQCGELPLIGGGIAPGRGLGFSATHRPPLAGQNKPVSRTPPQGSGAV